MARLDRLGDAREVAQIAAVIGRQFTLPLLDAVASKRGGELETALAKLVAAGIVFPEGGVWNGALVSSTRWCETLPMRVCCGAPAGMASAHRAALELRFPELAANEPELLAYHFGEAGLMELACDYRMRAGDRALESFSLSGSGRTFLGRAQIGRTLPEPADRMRRQLDFLFKLGPTLGDRPWHAKPRARGCLPAGPAKSAKHLGDGAARSKQNGAMAQCQSRTQNCAGARTRR